MFSKPEPGSCNINRRRRRGSDLSFHCPNKSPVRKKKKKGLRPRSYGSVSGFCEKPASSHLQSASRLGLKTPTYSKMESQLCGTFTGPLSRGGDRGFHYDSITLPRVCKAAPLQQLYIRCINLFFFLSFYLPLFLKTNDCSHWLFRSSD